jgi:hypothetical protein
VRRYRRARGAGWKARTTDRAQAAVAASHLVEQVEEARAREGASFASCSEGFSIASADEADRQAMCVAAALCGRIS